MTEEIKIECCEERLGKLYKLKFCDDFMILHNSELRLIVTACRDLTISRTFSIFDSGFMLKIILPHNIVDNDYMIYAHIYKYKLGDYCFIERGFHISLKAITNAIELQ